MVAGAGRAGSDALKVGLDVRGNRGRLVVRESQDVAHKVTGGSQVRALSEAPPPEYGSCTTSERLSGRVAVLTTSWV